ncbi:ester cyclase [Planococcus sp. 4-30]|uniref:ester cyclase n=1 Tax=Planococcus sp. 4-30 TaxID=2874583 RepID=UPI001CC0328E|nr:ester cyclase [Planococcus sp. 4-30]
MSNKDLYRKWMEAWNTDISLIDEIAHHECIVHQARTDGKDSKRYSGPEALRDVILSGTYFFDEYQMSLIVEPIEEGNYISARWNFTGKYNGKMDGVTVDRGKEISFDGTDIFYIENKKIKGYWVSSDGVDFMKQLKLI